MMRRIRVPTFLTFLTTIRASKTQLRSNLRKGVQLLGFLRVVRGLALIRMVVALLIQRRERLSKLRSSGSLLCSPNISNEKGTMIPTRVRNLYLEITG